MSKRHFSEATATLAVTRFLMTGVATAQTVWFEDEDSKTYPYLPDQGEAYLYAYVGAWCTNGQPRATYSDWVHDEDGSYATPNPPYDYEFDTGRFGSEEWNGGWSQTQLTAYGEPIYQPAYASVPNLPPSPYCPT